MRLGVLGNDARIAALAAAAAGRGDRVLATCTGSGDGRGFDELLEPAACDGVLVAAADWDERRAEDIRTLVQAGRPLVVAHPPGLSMIWAWEMEMIRQDAGGPLVPLLPERLHPFVARLRAAIEAAVAGERGTADGPSIVMERRLADRRRGAVLAALSRDVDLVRIVVGEPARVQALGPAADDDVWSSLTVGLSGPNHVPVRWQVAAGEPGLAITLYRPGGETRLEIPDAWEKPWTFTGPGGPEPPAPFDPAARILGLLAGAAAPQAVPPGTVPPATWADAARAVEIAETVPRSITRGRAIDLHREEFSELGTFRGTMASLGCGLIMAALVVVVLAAVLGGLAEELGWEAGGKFVGRAWPAAILVVLAGFLALQLLPWLVRDGRRHE